MGGGRGERRVQLSMITGMRTKLMPWTMQCSRQLVRFYTELVRGRGL